MGEHKQHTSTRNMKSPAAPASGTSGLALKTTASAIAFASLDDMSDKEIRVTAEVDKPVPTAMQFGDAGVILFTNYITLGLALCGSYLVFQSKEEPEQPEQPERSTFRLIIDKMKPIFLFVFHFL